MSGVKNLRQGIATLTKLAASIRDLPVRIRVEVAEDALGALSSELRRDFASGQTVYNTLRPSSVAGRKLSLVRTGATRSELGFVRIGTILRAQLGTKYARFLIGKYGILPQTLPVKWQQLLVGIVAKRREKFARENGGRP